MSIRVMFEATENQETTNKYKRNCLKSIHFQLYMKMDRFRRIVAVYCLTYHLFWRPAFSEFPLPKSHSEGGKVPNLNGNNRQIPWNSTFNGNIMAKSYHTGSTSGLSPTNPYVMRELLRYYNNMYPINPYHVPGPYNNNHYLPPTTSSTEKGLLFPLPVGQYPSAFPHAQFPPFPTTPAIAPGSIQNGGFIPGLAPPLLNTKPPFLNHLPLPPPIGGPHHQYLRPFDIGSFPNQVRFPGSPTVQTSPEHRIIEITCEFPRYLILVQTIFWHFKYSHDPYGTYFDKQNVFSPRIHVNNIDNWKSVLTIKPYTEDDIGTYRCLSAAILPTFHNSGTDLLGLGTKGTLNSLPSPSSASLSLQDATAYDYESKEAPQLSSDEAKLMKKPRVTRVMKFPSSKKRSIRFTPDPEISNSLVESIEKPMRLNDKSSNQFFEKVYDRFGQQRSSSSEAWQRSSDEAHLPQGTHNQNAKRPSVDTTATSSRHLPLLSSLFNSFQQNTGQFSPSFQYPPLPNPQVGPIFPSVGLDAPFYKPTFGIVTIYQEVNLSPASWGGVFRNKFYRF